MNSAPAIPYDFPNQRTFASVTEARAVDTADEAVLRSLRNQLAAERERNRLQAEEINALHTDVLHYQKQALKYHEHLRQAIADRDAAIHELANALRGGHGARVQTDSIGEAV